MKLSLATNFDDALIERIKNHPIVEMYGKLGEDAVGGGRASFQIGRISKKRVRDHIALCHRHGIEFNYLLNTTALGNMEYTRRGQRAINTLLGWLCDIGVDSVTVAIPYLLMLIKTRFPQLRVKIGVFAAVDTVQKAHWWEDMGADAINLVSTTVNREFDILRAIRKAVSCDLVLMANNNCLMSCPMTAYHANVLSHASQKGHPSKGFAVDHCFLTCTHAKTADGVNYLRSEWIRPEDLHHYEDIGYHTFKLVERGAPTDALVLRVNAYSERHYDGNLLDLVQPYGFRRTAGRTAPGMDAPGGWRWALRYFVKPLRANPLRMRKIADLMGTTGMMFTAPEKPPVYIDNRKLDGFIARFLKEGCRAKDCETCRYCHEWAGRTVEYDGPTRKRALGLYETIFDGLNTGSIFEYSKRGRSVPLPVLNPPCHG